MADNKRKAEGPLDERGRRSRPRAYTEPKNTIDTLEPWPLSMKVEELTADLLPVAFQNLGRGRQLIDLWTVLTSSYTGTDIALFGAWTRIKRITAETIMQWKHGPEVSSLSDRRPTGAQGSTRIMKTLRMLEVETQRDEMTSLRAAAIQMELDYMMLLYGTNHHVVDEMVPDNKERTAHLIRALSDGSFINEPTHEPTHEPINKSPNVEAVAGSNTSNSLEDSIMSFKQEVDQAEVPSFVGYADIIDMLDDLVEIPQIFKHLIEPRSSVGFQGILLFGPPGTGKTLLAQMLTAKKGLTFFKVPADQLISKWVEETEKYESRRQTCGYL
ncbi:MAG: hypothetical protein Q9191_008377 [Dirinaria sp. TL-2023a]